MTPAELDAARPNFPDVLFEVVPIRDSNDVITHHSLRASKTVPARSSADGGEPTWITLGIKAAEPFEIYPVGALPTLANRLRRYVEDDA